MIRKIALATAGVLASTVLALSLGTAPASAGTADTDHRAAASSDATVDLTYRGSYWNYYDCDTAGFSGIYNGYWTAYLCNWRNGANVWDLYAG